MAELSFNKDHGYLEGLVRGMKAGILTDTDYHNLAQCDTLDGKHVGVGEANVQALDEVELYTSRWE